MIYERTQRLHFISFQPHLSRTWHLIRFFACQFSSRIANCCPPVAVQQVHDPRVHDCDDCGLADMKEANLFPHDLL